MTRKGGRKSQGNCQFPHLLVTEPVKINRYTNGQNGREIAFSHRFVSWLIPASSHTQSLNNSRLLIPELIFKRIMGLRPIFTPTYCAEKEGENRKFPGISWARWINCFHQIHWGSHFSFSRITENCWWNTHAFAGFPQPADPKWKDWESTVISPNVTIVVWRVKTSLSNPQ